MKIVNKKKDFKIILIFLIEKEVYFTLTDNSLKVMKDGKALAVNERVELELSEVKQVERDFYFF